MVNMIKSAKDQITNLINNSLKSSQSAGLISHIPPAPVTLEKPKEKAHGDFSCTYCLWAAKQLKMPPFKLAQIIVSNLDIKDTYIEKFEIAGPGFINFYLKDKWRGDSIKALFENPDQYGKTNFGNQKKVMVEFVSANPTGPMHMGNARGGALGDTLAGVLSWAGYDVTREFYVNDAGNQVDKFFNSLIVRYKQLLLGEDAAKFPDDGYHGDDIKQRAKEFLDLYGDLYLNKSQDEQKNAIVGYALKANVEDIKNDLKKYRVCFDNWFYESSLYESGEVQDTIDLLKTKGYTYEKDGALWFDLSGFNIEKDEVLVRANGVPTYFAADIAYHRNKIEKRGFEWVINVWGADHHGHVDRMKQSLNAIGVDSKKLDVILMQLVRLVRGKEVVRMSKRTGKSITLTDLLEETSIDAARFFFNMRQNNSHLEFDLDLAIEQSNQNPVFYVQYAHARICSILNVLSQSEASPLPADQVDFTLLKEPEELDLINHIISLPEEIIVSSTTLDPSRLTKYVIELAAMFHRFYNACRVKVDDQSLLNARLKLVQATRIVLKNVLMLLKITAPEKM